MPLLLLVIVIVGTVSIAGLYKAYGFGFMEVSSRDCLEVLNSNWKSEKQIHSEIERLKRKSVRTDEVRICLNRLNIRGEIEGMFVEKEFQSYFRKKPTDPERLFIPAQPLSAAA